MIVEYQIEDKSLGELEESSRGKYYTASIKVKGESLLIIVPYAKGYLFKQIEIGKTAFIKKEGDIYSNFDGKYMSKYSIPSEIEVLRFRIEKQEKLINELIKLNDLKWKN